MNLDEIEKEARKEIEQEKRLILIKEAKVRILSKKPLWHKIFPFVVIIKRR